MTEYFEIMEQVIKKSSYMVLRNEPALDGSTMSHDEVKDVLKLSDDQAELYRSEWENSHERDKYGKFTV